MVNKVHELHPVGKRKQRKQRTQSTQSTINGQAQTNTTPGKCRNEPIMNPEPSVSFPGPRMEPAKARMED